MGFLTAFVVRFMKFRTGYEWDINMGFSLDCSCDLLRYSREVKGFSGIQYQQSDMWEFP